MNNIKLIQESKSGKTKILEIRTEENQILRSWGLEGCKMQTSVTACTGKNIGKANETTGAQQAEAEAEAIITRKLHEGYRRDTEPIPSGVLDFDHLQSSFAPSKPITTPPKDFELNMGEYCAERKNNGVCLIRVVTPSGRIMTFSRGMRDLTHIVCDLPPIIKFNSSVLPLGTIVLYEFVHYNAAGKEVPKDLRGLVHDKTTREKANLRYNELIATGSTFRTVAFDILVLGSKPTTALWYEDRRLLLKNLIWDEAPAAMSEYFPQVTTEIINDAKTKGWEGLVLRKLSGPLSLVEYTMNGKPSRKGAWKYVFEKSADFVITGYSLGESGRLVGIPATFNLGQYDEEGNIVNCGSAGPGKVPTEELSKFKELYGETMSQGNLVAEIVFRNRSEETDALEFPVIQRFRVDKPGKECLLNE